MRANIRECSVDDCEAIQYINTVEMHYEYSLENTKDALKYCINSDTDKIFVAVVENRVVGYVHIQHYVTLYARPMKNIMGIAVLSEYKKQGIGRSLLETVEKWAKETSDVEGIRLVSGSTRIEAHEFYRRCGYQGGKQQLNFKKFIE